MSDFIITLDGHDTTPDKALDRIRKCIALGEDQGATPAERENALAKAAKLCATFGITMKLAGISRPGSDEMIIKEFTIDSNWPREEGQLCYKIMEALGCKCIVESQNVVTVVGYVSDIERGEVLYTSLSLQMFSAVSRDLPRDSLATWRGYMRGYIAEVYARLCKAEHKAAQESGQPGTDIVLRDRNQQVLDAFKAEFPHTRAVASRGDASASGLGAAAGRSAHIGGPSVSNNRRMAIAG